MVIALIRTVILYLIIIAGVRLLGKRQVGELEPSELVVALVIADLAAVPMQDFGIPLLFGVLPIAVLLCLTLLLSLLSMHSVRFRALVCGRPSVIVENGVLHQKEMIRNRLTIDELTEELRLKGFTDISTVKYAILETNGQLSVLPFSNRKPPTAQALGVPTEEGGLPLVIINDGRVLEQNLTLRGYDRDWLREQLSQRGVQDPAGVFLMTVDELGRIYYAKKEV